LEGIFDVKIKDKISFRSERRLNDAFFIDSNCDVSFIELVDLASSYEVAKGIRGIVGKEGL
jgi:hypothetical protein